MCKSTSPPPLAAPCPPTNVNSSMDCLSNIAVVTWSGSAGAEFYTAAVTDWQGGETCMSSSEQCGMPNLDCGQNYTVTVTALRQNCPSEPSASSTLQSGRGGTPSTLQSGRGGAPRRVSSEAAQLSVNARRYDV